MTTPTDYRALCAELLKEWDAANGDQDLLAVADVIDRARTLLSQPEPESAATQLGARSLLERVARMADCIGQQTVAEIAAISNQAAAWLNANPPGQP